MAKSAAGRHTTPFDVLVTKQWGPISEREWARRTRCARQTVTAWREGRSLPHAHTIMRLADLLGVPTSELAEAVGETVRRGREARTP